MSLKNVKALSRKQSPTGVSLHLLEKKIFQSLKEYFKRLENKTLLVGVSGGIDSIALLHLLLALQSRLKFKLVVSHVNHAVRGKASDQDSLFVKKTCQKLKIKAMISKINWDGNLIPLNKKTPSENLLREKRYELLFSHMKKVKASFIVTAHHRDDLLETRLMRLFQGTGSKGLKAMEVWGSQNILRPLLYDASKEEIKNYVKEKKLSYREDLSNQETQKLRNWVRKKWLSSLKREHPEYTDNLFLSLERLVSSGAEGGARREAPLRTGEALKREAGMKDERVYNYLRHFSKHRVTSNHVDEFKKRLKTPRKCFTFRLAGVDWNVSEKDVRPV